MKLFYAPKTRSIRPRWMLEELGVPYELVTIDLKKGEQKSPDFLKINPMAAVPALQDGNLTLFESGAIVAYLADKYLEKKMAPAIGTPERGKYYQWLAFALSTLDNPIVNYYFHTDMYPPEKRIAGIAETCKGLVSRALKVLNEELKGKEFLIGNSLTAADVLVGANLSFAKTLKLADDFPNVLEYTKRLTSRPAFRKALE